MTDLTPEQALERAQAAAEVAREAADAAQGYADSLAAAATVATGGGVDPTVFRIAIFVLAIFVGYYVVWAVTPALHTPLMSVTNAISSVIVVAAAAMTDSGAGWGAQVFGFLALVMASVNIFGGFLVTQRMLAMYKKKG
jgi:NAD(P) transhydrogenase subunit alpha